MTDTQLRGFAMYADKLASHVRPVTLRILDSRSNTTKDYPGKFNDLTNTIDAFGIVTSAQVFETTLRSIYGSNYSIVEII